MEELKPLTRDEIEKKIDMFYNALKPYAKDSGFFMSVMLGQVGIESYWGTSTLAKKANNFTGHKFKEPFSNVRPNDYFIKDAGEEEDGKKVVYEDEKWRKYKDIDDWAKHHADWLTQSDWYKNHYKNAINAKTPEEQLKALTRVYATDSNYYTKVMEVINDYGLKKYDKEKETTNMAYIGIDIGHGKNSPARGGSKGWTGDEHSFNSKVAIRTKALLESMGHKVTFGVQNPNSNEVGLAPRTSYFNAQKVDVLVSIHANAHSNTTVNGVSAFYDRYGRGRDSASLKLAKAIMDEYRKQKQVIWSTGEVPSYSGNWTDFHMNRESTMPSVLMELGFMTGNRDREYVFGSKQAQFVEDMAQGIASGVNKYFGGGSVGGSKPAANEIAWPDYRKPTQPFDALKVGDKVTIRKGQSAWYIPATPKIGKKTSKDFAGDKDTITKVMDVNVGYSKKAYLLKDKISWILEQDLENARDSWKETAEAKFHTVKSGEYLYLIGEKYGITVANIKDWNGLSSNVIFSGQKLFVEDPAKKSQKPVETVPENVIESPNTEQPKDEGSKTPAVELKDGEFMWNGVKYKIVEEVI